MISLPRTAPAHFLSFILGSVGFIALGVLGACPAPTPPAAHDAGVAAPPASAHGDGGVAVSNTPKRPPYPNMATAAWGQRVLEQKMQALAVDAPASSQSAVLDVLHDMSPGSEAHAADLAAAWCKSAKTPAERGESLALLSVALVLDPTVEGYKDRLTDAYGLAAYAGTLEQASALSQSARALVGASAGSVEQAKRLVEVIENTPGLGPEPRLFMALTQKLTGGKLDAVLDDVNKALAARPDSARARALLAELYLDVGMYPEAAKAATTKPGTTAHPWLDAVRGRALVLDGNVDEGVKLLKASQEKLDEGRRGDALYWLGRSLTQKEGNDAEVQTIVASLSARPGYAKEGAVLEALTAQKAGDYEKAKARLEPLIKGPPILPADVDATWLLVDACAGAGDLLCVDKAGARAVSADDDYGRLNLARAAAILVGKAEGDANEALKEAHRASPFDPKLAAKLHDPVVDGGTAAANRVRAARRAVVRRSPKLVTEALAPLAKNASCRVCRALGAAASTGLDAAKNGVKAVSGAGPPLCVADLVAVANALGAVPIDEATKALDSLDKDPREPIKRAVERARQDQKDPDVRRRRDAGVRDVRGGAPEGPPMIPGMPPPDAAPPKAPPGKTP